MALANDTKPTLEEIRLVLAGDSVLPQKRCTHVTKEAVVCNAELLYRNASLRCRRHTNVDGWKPCAHPVTCRGFGMVKLKNARGVCRKCSSVLAQRAQRAKRANKKPKQTETDGV